MTYIKSRHYISRGYYCSCPERLLCLRNRDKKTTICLKKGKDWEWADKGCHSAWIKEVDRFEDIQRQREHEVLGFILWLHLNNSFACHNLFTNSNVIILLDNVHTALLILMLHICTEKLYCQRTEWESNL